MAGSGLPGDPVYATQSQDDWIKKIAPNGKITRYTPLGDADGPLKSAGLSDISELLMDHSGNLIVTTGHRVRHISKDGYVTTLAGGGLWGVTEGLGRDVGLASPRLMGVDAAGSVYLSDYFDWELFYKIVRTEED